MYADVNVKILQGDSFSWKTFKIAIGVSGSNSIQEIVFDTLVWLVLF